MSKDSSGNTSTKSDYIHENLLLKVVREWNDTFDAVSDLFIAHDRDFNIVRCNQVLASFVGASQRTSSAENFTM